MLYLMMLPFSHIKASNVNNSTHTLRKTFAQNSPRSETVPPTQPLTSTFRETKSPVLTAIISIKMLSTQQKSLNLFFLSFSNQLSHKSVSIRSVVASYFEHKHHDKNREFPFYFSSEGLGQL